jgi:hypothetical protein
MFDRSTATEIIELLEKRILVRLQDAASRLREYYPGLKITP